MKSLYVCQGLVWILSLFGAGCVQDVESVAILFVGHGEPATYQEGIQRGEFSDGTRLGPSGNSLGVPPAEQSTIWAAGYEEIATAMTYQFGDSNQNGVLHEVAIHPQGDVPGFFTWDAFKTRISYALTQHHMSFATIRGRPAAPGLRARVRELG